MPALSWKSVDCAHVGACLEQWQPLSEQTLSLSDLSSQWEVVDSVPPPGCCQDSQLDRDEKAPQLRVTQLPMHRESGGSADGAAPNLAAVVVTLRNGVSYDEVFQHVPQRSVVGTYVAAYQVSGPVKALLAALKGEAGDPTSDAAAGSSLERLVEDVRAVDPGSVTFNWECCSACASESFGSPEETEAVLELVEFLLCHCGHVVMCSDFSMKALIKQWRSTPRLGPNPFVKLGEFYGSMDLRFDPSRLSACPSAQLQQTGSLCDGGCATIQASVGSLVYSVDHRVPESTEAYKLEVLTIARAVTGFDLSDVAAELTCEAGGHQGVAGHVLVRYPSGGALLASAGHWIELVRLDVSEARLLETPQAQYGETHSEELYVRLPSMKARSSSAKALAPNL